ncbi:MAG TPA: tetraacyldisaccharide 4'-kinase, partial [Anaeromyxobacter sp.]
MTLLEEIWWSRAPRPAARLLAAPLLAAEAVFRAGVALRAALHDGGLLRAAGAGAPVISVGNLAVGGAGKTPAAMAVARRLVARGRAVALLSRGYGAVRGDARVVSDGARVLLGAAEAGDEPALLARRLPGVRVLCGPRRTELARTAVESLGADVLLLDDGFQHRALARDLDVVVLDGPDAFGNGRLLPAGPNREPRSALRRAHLVWLSRVDQADPAAVDRLRALALEATGRAPVESRHAPVDVLDGALARGFGVEALRGRRVLLLAGIARPAGFRRTVAALGGAIAAERLFPDHHRFGAGEIEAALREADGMRCEAVVTTEKDAVRLPPEAARDPRIRVVRIDAEIVAGAEGLEAAL